MRRSRWVSRMLPGAARPATKIIMNQQKNISLAITFLALVIAFAHIIWPDLKIDGVTLGLLVVAVIPWLAPLFKKIKLPGGWEIEYQEVKRMAQEAQGAAQSASNKAELAISGASGHPSKDFTQDVISVDEQIRKLAQEYNHIRATQKSGIHRTSEMTAIVSKMIALAPILENIEISSTLNETDRGKRLFGYALLYKIPNFNFIKDLVKSVTTIEDKPFGQYWGLQAIGKTLEGKSREDVPIGLIRSLEDFQSRLRKGTDRYYEISRILRDLD